MRLFGWCQIFFCSCLLRCGKHWIKYAGIPVFIDQYSRVWRQNHIFCTDTREYGKSIFSHILCCKKHQCVVIVNVYSHIWNTALYNYDIATVSKLWKFPFYVAVYYFPILPFLSLRWIIDLLFLLTAIVLFCI